MLFIPGKSGRVVTLPVASVGHWIYLTLNLLWGLLEFKVMDNNFLCRGPSPVEPSAMGRVATFSVCCSHVAMQATLSAKAIIVAAHWKNRGMSKEVQADPFLG